MAKQWMKVVALVATLSGCALLQPGRDPADAQAAGLDAGTLVCAVLIGEAPELRSQVEAAITRASKVLAAPDITGAAVVEALSEIRDWRWRIYAQSAVRILLRRMTGAGLDVTLPPNSPAVVGAKAFFTACSRIVAA